MKIRMAALCGGLAISMSACGGGQLQLPSPGARAELADVNGNSVGSATLHQVGNDVVIRANITLEGTLARGFHVHAVGRCEPPFETAGGHFNPAGRQHGFLNPAGSHAGDLANLLADGQTHDHTREGLALESLLDADGSALVVHATQDDYKTDPSGNSGARVACGVIRRP